MIQDTPTSWEAEFENLHDHKTLLNVDHDGLKAFIARQIAESQRLAAEEILKMFQEELVNKHLSTIGGHFDLAEDIESFQQHVAHKFSNYD